MSFESPKEKLTIASLDDPGTQVTAQYNPKEVQIDRTVPWQQHAKGNANALQLEYTGAAPREMTLEMFFDYFEIGFSVQGDVDTLEELATVQDEDGEFQWMRRPHFCVVKWGVKGIPEFRCVIESLSTKYSMFLADGTPVRATVTVKLKEANRLSMKVDKPNDGSQPDAGAPDTDSEAAEHDE